MTATQEIISQDDSNAAAAHKAYHSSSSSMALPPPPPLGSQLDVAMLDNYLHSLLLTKFLQSLDPLVQILMNSGGRHDTLWQQQHHDTLRTLRIILSSCLPALTLWMTHLQTPATKALGLQSVMIPSKSSSQKNAASGVLATKWKYIFFTALLPLGYQILQRIVVDMQQQEQRNEEDENFTNNSHDEAQRRRRRIARERQYQVARRIVQSIQQGIPVLKLGLLLSLLFKPKSKSHSSTALAPSLSMALSGVAFVTAAATRSSSSLEDSTTTPSQQQQQQQQPGLYVLYAHRRWLYEESLQTCRLVFGPLLSSLRDWRQFIEEGLARVANVMVSRLVSPSILSRGQSAAVDGALLPVEQACSLCGKHPIAIPYETDACQHIFCYTCLWSKSNSSRSGTAVAPSAHNSTRQLAMGHAKESDPESLGTGYPCPTCHKLIRSSRPVPMQRYQQDKQQEHEQKQQRDKQEEIPAVE